MIQVEFQKNLIALEDLLQGVGTTQQTRGTAGLVTVTRINAANMTYDGTQTMAAVIADLQGQINSLPIVIDPSGDLLTGLIDSSSSDLSSTHAGRIWQRTINSTQTNVFWGNILMFQYNPTTGNIITEATAYIAADAVVTSAFEAADAAITTDYEAADAAITTAYIAADAVVAAAFASADTAHLASAEAYTDAQIVAAADYVDFVANQTEQAAVNASSNVTKTIAYSAGTWTPITVSSDFTLAFTFPSNKVVSMILAITNGGAHSITWPAGTLFPEGAAPALTSSGLDLVSVFQDGNNNLYAALVGNAFAT